MLATNNTRWHIYKSKSILMFTVAIAIILIISAVMNTFPVSAHGTEGGCKARKRGQPAKIYLWASGYRCQVEGGEIGIEYDDIKIYAQVVDSNGNECEGVPVTFTKTWYSPELGPVDWGNFEGDNPAYTDSDKGIAEITFNGKNCPDPEWDYWRPNPVVITASVGGITANITIYITWVKYTDGNGILQLRFFNSSIDNETMEYYEYLPPGFDPEQPHP